MARPRGRHSRPSKTSKVISASATTATTGAFAVIAVAAGTGPQHVLHMDKPAAVQVRETAFIAPETPSPSTVRTDAATTYTVTKGDTLSGIATTECGGQASDWTGIYDANHTQIPNPDLIEPGQNLVLDCTTEAVWQPAWWHAHHENHLAEVTRARPITRPAPPLQSGPPTVQTPVTNAAPVAHVSVSGDGGFQSCVISRESGGNPNIWNASGHWGLYQFSESTWEAYGGSAGSFGSASAAEQNQVFDNAMAQGGEGNWSPYDGCL